MVSGGVDEATVTETWAFVKKYGGWPSRSTPLGRKLSKLTLIGELADCAVDMVVMRCSTIKTADLFLNAVQQGKSTYPFAAWAARSRNRLSLKESVLSRALAASNAPGRPSPRNLQKHGDSLWAPQLQQENMDTDGAIPIVKKQTAAGVIHYTPQVVVNWLYQALTDVVVSLQAVLGTSKFNQCGSLVHAPGECPGVGEVLLWWGTHLGAVREQALIAWDYDIDLVVFLAPGVDIDMIWKAACQPLLALGYNICKHSAFKFRVSPVDPLAWAPFQELYQQVREANVGNGWGRPALMKATSTRWNDGELAGRPHGSNCVDVEFYHVAPRQEEVKIIGTKPFYVALKTLFPTAAGVFGPLSMPIPRCTDVLQQEYGMTWRNCFAKIRNGLHGFSWVEVPMQTSTRRAVWPCVCLHRCEHHLS
jgi:hypothetical protein